MNENTEIKLKTRLGTRLKALFDTIPEDTKIFWDLCCDHGALGRAVLETRPHCNVLFNDISHDITDRLSEMLKKISAKNFKIHTGTAENLSISDDSKLTVMLAGVGDELCISILKALFEQLGNLTVTFVVSPVNKVQNVREFLINSNVQLVNECLVTENNRSYEILKIRYPPAESNNLMKVENGDLFGKYWQKNNPDHTNHLNKLIKYYQIKATNSESEKSVKCVAGYKNILNKINLQT